MKSLVLAGLILAPLGCSKAPAEVRVAAENPPEAEKVADWNDPTTLKPTLRDEFAVRAAARELVSMIALGWTREDILKENELLGWNDADLVLMEQEIDRWHSLLEVYACLTPGAKQRWLEHTTDNPESGMMYEGSVEFIKSSKVFWRGRIRDYFGLPSDDREPEGS